jgi:RNA polymerase sigma factor (TIGR02999 family)
MSTPGEVTQLIQDLRAGEPGALDRLVPLVYDDLRRIAHRHLARRGLGGATVNTTALVHELYARLADRDRLAWEDRAHFFAVASRAMRQILLDYIKGRRRLKRGGEQVRVPLSGQEPGAQGRILDVLALDEALNALAEMHARLARVVECRFFGGMTVEETATALGVRPRTVERDWTRARVHLLKALSD